MLERREAVSAEVLEALRRVPRHEFVPESVRDRAYADRPLPIGDGQTISAPHMVAKMTDILDIGRGDRVLEIGTGCGYHAAVTAAVVGADNVFSVEISESLAAASQERLDRCGYGGVSIRIGDGREGWDEHAPYDAAYLTCAASELPSSVLEQVAPGGRVVGPVGTGVQTLHRAIVHEDGPPEWSTHGQVRFVGMRE